MRLSLLSVLLVVLLTCNQVFADEEKKADTDNSLFMPAFSLGFSYPLVFGMSLGALLPLGKQGKNDLFPTTPALRIDGEMGLGGGSAAAGLYIPVNDIFAVSLKAVCMRTWLLTWNEATNRTFNGGVVEFAIPSMHGGPKIGIGAFKDAESLDGRRDSFTYAFVGVGW